MNSKWREAGHSIADMAGPEVPALAVLFGSGLDSIADGMEVESRRTYRELPWFPAPSVAGHKGHLLVGKLEGTRIVALCGRTHYYEGASSATLAFPVRALKAAGIRRLLLTSAAGSLREDFGPGTLVSVADHISWSGASPLVGPNDDEAGERFVALDQAYDPAMRSELAAAAAGTGTELKDGVFMWYPGPNFETPAEIRAFRMLGADVVGMSTVPEIIAAAHCGLAAASVAVVTNYAAGLGGSGPHTHEQTLDSARQAAEQAGAVVAAFARGSSAE